MSEFWANLAWWEVALISIVLNVGLTVTAAMLWTVLSQTRRRPQREQWLPTVSTTLINALVAVPAWYLWQRGVIELASPSWRIPFEFLALALAMDTFLYWTHRTAHHRWFYPLFHKRHHTGDEVMTPLTLFVMHPFEASGFGLAMTAALIVLPLSVPAVALFVMLNLAAGTYAHLPVTEPSKSRFSWTRFHQRHHRQVDSNFGFFLPIWDRLAKTYES